MLVSVFPAVTYDAAPPVPCSVFGTTTTGRRVRILAVTEATAQYPAGFEIGLSLDETDGQWRLTWLPESEIQTIELVEE